MGRFRPPEKAGSKYITPRGAQRLREELEQLWRQERPRVTRAVAAAAPNDSVPLRNGRMLRPKAARAHCSMHPVWRLRRACSCH